MAVIKTVGELRKAIDGIDDRMEVILRITTDGGDSLHLMNIHAAEPGYGCTDTEAFMIDGYADQEGE